MSFRVRVTEAAFEDLAGIGAWIASEATQGVSERWLAKVMSGIRALAEMPARCAVAPESSEFEQEVRQYLFGDYCVLFVILAEDVVVLHVRHGSRREFNLTDIAAALAEISSPKIPE